MIELELDHLGYLADRGYRREIHSHLRRLHGHVSCVQVWHEGDDVCCQLEPWQTTAARITAAIGKYGAADAVFVEMRP